MLQVSLFWAQTKWQCEKTNCVFSEGADQGLIRLIMRIRTFSRVLVSTLTFWYLLWRVFMSLVLEMCWLDCVCSKFFSCEKIRTFSQVPAEEPRRRANLTDLIGFHLQTRPFTVTPIKQFKLFFALTSSDEYNNVTRAACSESWQKQK